jgi:hypothetical protein
VRGLALLSMFVAHGVPYGPDDVWVLSDFLTAALFGTLVGVGPGLRGRPGRSALLPSLVRGLVLVVLGLLLEQVGAQVVVILVHLGVLTWVVALLRPMPSWVLAAVAAWLALVSPVLQASWQGVYVDLLASGDVVSARVVEVVFVGSSYRLTTLTVWAVLGMLAARHLLRRRPGATSQLAPGVAALLVAAVLFFVLDRALGRIELVPYSGNLLEIGFNALLALGVLLCGSWTASHFPTRTLSQLGQMSLTVYSLHILWLGLLDAVVFEGRLDDSWWTFASLALGALVLAALWSRGLRSGAPARGPLEAGTDRLVGLVRPSGRT